MFIVVIGWIFELALCCHQEGKKFTIRYFHESGKFWKWHRCVQLQISSSSWDLSLNIKLLLENTPLSGSWFEMCVCVWWNYWWLGWWNEFWTREIEHFFKNLYIAVLINFFIKKLFQKWSGILPCILVSLSKVIFSFICCSRASSIRHGYKIVQMANIWNILSAILFNISFLYWESEIEFIPGRIRFSSGSYLISYLCWEQFFGLVRCKEELLAMNQLHLGTFATLFYTKLRNNKWQWDNQQHQLLNKIVSDYMIHIFVSR